MIRRLSRRMVSVLLRRIRVDGLVVVERGTLYLAYCEAGFAERRICDIQLLVTEPRSRLTSDDRPGSRGRSAPHDLAASA